MASPVDKLTPADPRVQHRTYKVPASGTTYHYLLAEPESTTTPAATILLVHGFPDLSFGWRYQVPHLLSLNLRVVVPDLVGFGRSDAPADLAAYSHKTVVEDLVAVVRDAQGKKEGEDVEKFLLGGHDWGGAVVWRFALWRPHVLRCVFSVCTPYLPPSQTYYSPEEVVKLLPNFAYQVQFNGTEVEESVQGRARIRALLSTMYGGRRADGEPVFSVSSGVDLDKLEEDKIGDSPLMSKEELDFYADEYVKNGMRGPLCWYKTRKVNFDEEKELLEQGRSKVTLPALMIMASRDSALPPAMAAGMDKYVDDLVKKEVDASHWALWERPAETNRHIEEFLTRILEGQPLKASI